MHTSFGILLLSLQFYMHAIIGKAGFMDSNQSPMAFLQFPLVSLKCRTNHLRRQCSEEFSLRTENAISSVTQLCPTLCDPMNCSTPGLPIGEGNGNPLQYSCLENPKDGGAWWALVHGVAMSRTRLSDFTFTFMHWRRKWQPTPVFLPGESQGRGSLVGCRLWGHTESDTTEVT